MRKPDLYTHHFLRSLHFSSISKLKLVNFKKFNALSYKQDIKLKSNYYEMIFKYALSFIVDNDKLLYSLFLTYFREFTDYKFWLVYRLQIKNNKGECELRTLLFW